MEIDVDSATILQLNWLVARCENKTVSIRQSQIGTRVEVRNYSFEDPTIHYPVPYSPTTDREISGPIIEREKIDLEYRKQSFGDGVPHWHACHPKNYGGLIRYTGYGPTPLVAAMRCYVKSVMGDLVQVPEELK